jgi:hypothetical protein
MGKPKIVIEMEGGLIQNITSNIGLKVLVLDADIEGGDEDRIREVANPDGSKEKVWSTGIEEPTVNSEYVGFYFKQFAEELCPVCHGKKTILCPYCEGESLDKEPCYECDSKGVVPCPECDGTGVKVNET